MNKGLPGKEQDDGKSIKDTRSILHKDLDVTVQYMS